MSLASSWPLDEKLSARLESQARRFFVSDEVSPVARGLVQAFCEAAGGGPLAGRVWIAGGAAGALGLSLARRQAAAGRRVIELVFALHARLQGNNPSQAPAVDPADCLSPYLPFFESCARAGSPWRAVAFQWIDVLGERLTMLRYASAGRRRHHARVLLALPLWTACGEEEAAGAEAGQVPPAMEGFALRVLGFWDLAHAGAMAGRGWNRVQMSDDAQMGGFFGLADQAAPLDEGQIRAQAQALLDDWRAELDDSSAQAGVCGEALPEALRAAAEATGRLCTGALEEFVARGQWPAWMSGASDGGGLWARLSKRFGF